MRFGSDCLKGLVMSYSYSDPPACCSRASPELKLYQAFIFSVPIFFTFILLLVFYMFYLRRQRVDWSSLRMRSSHPARGLANRQSELGLKKELREMLPIVIFKESFLIRETQCSVCLGDYKANEKLQQIPACGHTFHMDCIDLWLSNSTTCPLCRVSLLPPKPATSGTPSADGIQAAHQTIEAQHHHTLSSEGIGDAAVQRGGERTMPAATTVSQRGGESWDARRDERCESGGASCVVIDVQAPGHC